MFCNIFLRNSFYFLRVTRKARDLLAKKSFHVKQSSACWLALFHVKQAAIVPLLSFHVKQKELRAKPGVFHVKLFLL